MDEKDMDLTIKWMSGTVTSPYPSRPVPRNKPRGNPEPNPYFYRSRDDRGTAASQGPEKKKHVGRWWHDLTCFKKSTI